MKFPSALLHSLKNVKGFHEPGFSSVHEENTPPVSVRLNPRRIHFNDKNLPLKSDIPWCTQGRYLHSRPVFTLDPLFHAGAYYVQDASSMFVEQAVLSVQNQISLKTVLDISAAPGGKSTHLDSLLPKEALLVSNEINHGRASVLVENMTKWGAERCIVTQNTPQDYGRLGPQFDLILLDAPCSGSGLFRRDPEAIAHWSEEAVNHCALRQKEILTGLLACLKPGGFLIYSTCSFSESENEQIVDWLAETYQYEGQSIEWPDGKYGVVKTESERHQIEGYRFFPGNVEGEGFFISLLRKPGDHQSATTAVKKKLAPPIFPSGLNNMVQPEEGATFYNHAEDWFYFPKQVADFFYLNKQYLHIRKAGVKIATQKRDQFIPDHALALSGVMNQTYFNHYEVDKMDALKFLKKDEIVIEPSIQNGWVLITFQGLVLGWIKNMGNRNNNYYPKEWKIKMSIPD